MSRGHISNAASEKTGESWLDMSQINNSIVETTLGSVFGDNSNELKEGKRRRENIT